MFMQEGILLELLNSEDRLWYGSELLNASNRLGRGTIYIFLNRLAEKQLVYVDVEQEDVRGKKNQRGKRVYRITDEGRQTLENIRKGMYA